MCDYGAISGPLLVSALTSTGAASAAAAPAAAAAIANVASTALITGAGALATSYGMNQSQQAMNNAASQANENAYDIGQVERQRQQALQGERDAAFRSTLEGVSPQANLAEMEAQKAELSGKYGAPAEGIESIPIPGVPQGAAAEGAGPRVVEDAYRGKLGGVGSFLRNQGTAKAGLDAFTNSQISAGDKIRSGNNLIGLLNNFAQGSSGISDIERGVANQGGQYAIQNAQGAGDTAKTIGSLLSSVGTIGGYANAGNSVAPGKKKKGSGSLGSILSSQALGASPY